ncbi:protein-L-isoaspartate O-methyltransferase [Xylophilus sp. GOD-11R]|uniref:protein-L-isoaspartate O-methyltransferase family protein n=1 Tax=Xylophilus sp. GOD-11R TaxID=3089814 RepID=UPI00298CDD87|nr:protein-L-isoaspartate O-methyltransferase [Xylophilus sp. GOD-11R]WPB58487.1 protein-L-isoaspartate O-methyltransferase [Xylophilus sp. GOD-11R]
MSLPLNTPITHASSQDQARFNMIEQQIRPWDVADNDVLDLLAVLHREEFVPLAHRGLAFMDMEIPLPGGQNMLAPRVEARLLQDLRIQPHESVLEIGAGSGYMAALLARRAKRVLSLEIDPELAAFARDNLQRAGIANADVRVADGSQLPVDGGPFDVIVLSGSVAQVPAVLLDQLRRGGRLGAIVGDLPMMRTHIITRTGEASFETAEPWDTVAQRLQNFPTPSRFHF